MGCSTVLSKHQGAKSSYSIPSAVQPLEAAHSLEHGMPVGEQAVGLRLSCAARQVLPGQAVSSTLLCSLLPVL